ncbi:hypothetical protein HPB47_012597 [Ixodes persulcatus]|uniref:Uncharacterized protein n=1 Tax=Ixodes persulcatus TaxID=34615 RepID=A0AC60NT30_IXOPE|nr:hypothetical protein HPB47_012597 [Ixodes persulcatus]
MQRLSVYVDSKLLRRPGRKKPLHSVKNAKRTRNSESRSRSSEMRWVQTVISKGVLADKVAAHTLLIQESPVHNTASLDALLAMVTPKGKKECVMAIDALRDLFLSDLLRPDEKLKAFSQRPLEDVNASDIVGARKLLLWHFEDTLKQKYASFLQSLETVSFDQVEKLKMRAVTCMFHMLTYNPEREQLLLQRLVNKLGDRAHSVSSRVAHLLSQLTNHHPLIKPSVVAEVERLIYRPNVAAKAQYYALCFLSQLLLSDDEGPLARKLVSLYFDFFKRCVQKAQADSRTLRVLLTGVNRAFPYARAGAPEGTGVPDDQLDLMFRLVHLMDFNIATQTLMLLFQVMDAKSSLSDRFYGALYRKSLDPALEHSTQQTLFLNLLYRALKRDEEDRRVKAFLKRVLQACLYQTPHLACGMLVLVSEVLKIRPKLLETRSFDTTARDAPPTNGIAGDADDDSEDEHYEDAPDDSDDDESSAPKPVSKEAPAATAPKSSWVHTVSASTSRSSEGKPRAPRGYEPLARNPLYCGAEHSAAWELRHLSQHHHPTVALFASRVLSGRPVAYPGDPLQDFTLSRFLDRFVYRNPKKVAPPDEYKEKDLAGNVFGKRRQYVPTGARKMHVLSREYMGQDVSRIPPEEQYLYRYFQQTGGLKEKKKKKKDEEEDESEAESVASDDVEAVLNLCEPGVDGELDFAGDFVAAKGKKKRMKSGDGSDESDDDGDLDEDEDDDVDLAGLEDDEEYKQALEELNIGKGRAIREEDIEFSDEDEFGDAGPSKRKGKPGRAKDKSFNMSGLLASAEQSSNSRLPKLLWTVCHIQPRCRNADRIATGGSLTLLGFHRAEIEEPLFWTR